MKFILQVILLALPSVGLSQTISTVAGTGLAEGLSVQIAQVANATAITVDAAGNVYYFDAGFMRLRKVSAAGVVTTIAGNGLTGYAGDGGPAELATFNQVTGLAADSAGNVYVADSNNLRIRKVSSDGLVTTVAGNGSLQTQPGEVAVSTGLFYPSAVALDPSGSLVIGTDDASIYRVSGGVIQRIAGTGSYAVSEYAPDGSVATSQSLGVIRGIAVDASGAIYFGQSQFGRVRKISPQGVLSTYAGNGIDGVSGDGGPALSAAIGRISYLILDSVGNLYIGGDPLGDGLSSCRVRKVSVAGAISTVAGIGSCADSLDGGAATGSSLNRIHSLAIDQSGNLLISTGRIRKVLGDGTITAFVGVSIGGLAVEGESPASARLDAVSALRGTAGGGFLYASANRIRELAAGSISTRVGVSGNLATDSLPLDQFVLDGAGNIYATASNLNRIYRVSPTGGLTVFGGTGEFGFSGDGGAATSARFYYPKGIALDASGHVVIADAINNRIRKIDLAGVVTTIAGTGAQGSSPDGTPAISGQLNSPRLLAYSPSGELHYVESLNYRVRKINGMGNLESVAGTGIAGNSGDGGPALSAQLGFIDGIAFDTAGNLYLSDRTHSVIRRVSQAGAISTVAGSGVAGFLGDGGNPLQARLNQPGGIAIDVSGDLLVADNGNLRIRKVQLNQASVPPSPPVITSALPGSGQVTVNFTSAGAGSSPIIDYTATCSSVSPVGSLSVTGTASPIVVTGLSNFVSYTCTVVARNSVGTGPASSASSSVVPNDGPYLLNIAKSGSGSGVVTSAALGINCGSTCSANVAYGTSVTLIAVPTPGSAFAGWTGVSCNGGNNAAFCTFTPTQNTQISSNFVSLLSLGSAVSASLRPGNVFTAPYSLCAGSSDIAAGSITWLYTTNHLGAIVEIARDLNGNQLVDSGEGFSWSSALPEGLAPGACITILVRVSGINSGVNGQIINVTFGARLPQMPPDEYVSSSLALVIDNGVSLSILKAGPGAGLVTGLGSGITCGADCNENLASGTAVTLTATPNGGSVFAGWSGVACTGGNSSTTCSFSLTANTTVTATFNTAAPVDVAFPDFNADNKPDLIWRNSTGVAYLWYMNGPALISDAFIANIDPSWKIVGVADFNGDGHPDLVWRNGSGNTYVWYMNGASFISDAFLFSLPPEWVIQGVADFNKDGKPDFLMRNTVSGNAFVWFFNNASPIGDQFLFNIDPSWKVEGVADLNADGQPDLLFRNMASGLAFAWNSQFSGGNLSLTTSSPPIFSIDPAWEIVQVADWNADGKPDLVFRNKNSGVVFVWYLNGTTLTTSDFIIQIDPSWEIVPRK